MEGLGGLVPTLKFGSEMKATPADKLRRLWWLPVKEEPSPLMRYIDSDKDPHVFSLE